MNEAANTGTGFVADRSGGVPAKICDNCGVHGFLSDSRHVVVVAMSAKAIQVVDTVSGVTQDALTVSEGLIDRPHISPNDRWIAFRKLKDTSGKSYVAALQPGHPPAAESWKEVQEPTFTGRPTGWSPDSKTLYLLLDTDGSRCLWGQQINETTGALVGEVFAARHFHASDFAGMSTSYQNAIDREGFLYGIRRPTGNIWLLEPKSH